MDEIKPINPVNISKELVASLELYDEMVRDLGMEYLEIMVPEKPSKHREVRR